MERKSVLVIDDEPYIQEVTQVCLETIAGWQVLTAGSGQEGVVRAAREQPDVILLDVMMPSMDGIMTFQQLQNDPLTRHIPVILLTAALQASDCERYQALGIVTTLSKPFEPLMLATQIAQALGWPFHL